MKPILQKNRWVIGTALVIALGVGVGFLTPWQSKEPNQAIAKVIPKPQEPQIVYQELSWKDLKALDLTTGQAPAELTSLHEQHVKIPGFVVPLDDQAQTYSDFLLVPAAAACIHVPLPPANQMVLVTMKEGNGPKRRWAPVWIKGTLRITSSENSFGTVSYKLQAHGTEEWTENN